MFGAVGAQPIQTALALNLQVKYGIVVLSFVGECTPYRPIGGPTHPPVACP